MAATAAAVIAVATPANASVTFSSYNGPDLATAIHASSTNTAEDVATVFGCTQNNGQCADVTFTGAGQNMSTPEAIHITGGAGFASVTDAPGNATNNLYTLLIDVTSDNFNQYMFSIQLVNDGTLFVYYQLASGPGWNQANPVGGIGQKANANNTYVLQGDVFDQILIYSTSPIKEFKQNSITLGSVPAPVPEPATWAMMLLGFGGMGMALRRSRRRGKQTLMQIA